MIVVYEVAAIYDTLLDVLFSAAAVFFVLSQASDMIVLFADLWLWPILQLPLLVCC